MAEAAALIGRHEATVRRWFDEDHEASDGRPRPGRWIQTGRTGGAERRIDPAWAQAQRRRVAAIEEAAGQAPADPTNLGDQHAG